MSSKNDLFVFAMNEEELTSMWICQIIYFNIQNKEFIINVIVVAGQQASVWSELQQ